MSLRRATWIFAAVMALIVGCTATTLIVLTTRLHVAAHEIGQGAEGLRVGEEIEFGLISLRDAAGPEARMASEELLRHELEEADQYAGAGAERALLQDLSRKVDAYITEIEHRASEAAPAPTDHEPAMAAFESAFLAARRWARFNYEESQVLRVQEVRWDRLATFVGGASVLLLVGGIGVLGWWLRRRTFTPALQMVGTIERYAGGDRAARAPENGAQELRTIAHQFNDMASTLEHQRAGQLVFLAGVAHDLRNPLGALKLAVENVSPDLPLPPEPRIRQLFVRVGRQIERLERMVYDFLDASRIESGHLELVMEDCDVRDVARETVDLFETSPIHKLVTTIPDEPVRATCDPVRIEQVLSNLVANAIKYSPKGGTVHVAVARRPELVEVAVSDQGLGMSAEDIEHLFEPFRRTLASKNAIPGVGLGLFVAKRIVEAHGGHLLVESTPGVGSKFTVQLPVRT